MSLVNTIYVRHEQGSRGSCVIVGEDGWDICVLVNLLAFYSNLGFSACFSTKIVPADLVVIMRHRSPSALHFEVLPQNTPVHVYSYVGHSPLPLLDALRDRPASLFSPSSTLEPGEGWAYRCITHPPVSVHHWTQPPKRRTIHLCHIGNYKPDQSDDAWQARSQLVGLLRSAQAHVWGTGWSDAVTGLNVQGPLPITQVANIYSAADIGVGLMYPFQIQAQTISSRFWQAPLCGTQLVCEKEVASWTGSMPGILPVGYARSALPVERDLRQAEELQVEACAYWGRQWYRARDFVEDSLRQFPPTDTTPVDQRTLLEGQAFLLKKHRILYA